MADKVTLDELRTKYSLNDVDLMNILLDANEDAMERRRKRNQ